MITPTLTIGSARSEVHSVHKSVCTTTLRWAILQPSEGVHTIHNMHAHHHQQVSSPSHHKSHPSGSRVATYYFNNNNNNQQQSTTTATLLLTANYTVWAGPPGSQLLPSPSPAVTPVPPRPTNRGWGSQVRKHGYANKAPLQGFP